MDRIHLITLLETATGQNPAGDPRRALAELDAIDLKQLPRDLEHFLSRRSYQKALAWLAEEAGQAEE